MASANPFFSVVVPVYNKAPCLDRSIKSVLAQTFTDFELLLVDDASTDESLNEIRKFSDRRIRMLHRDVPGPGGYAARNLGVAESRAKWVAFLDADDEWFSNHLDVLHALAFQSRGGVVATGWLTKSGGGNVRPNRFSTFYQGSHPKQLTFQQFLGEAARERIPMWTGSVAARREVLCAAGGFPERCKRGGDIALWLRLVHAAGELLTSPQRTAVYHRVDSFVIETTPPEVQNNCVSKACNALIEGGAQKPVVTLLKQVSNVHVSHGLRERFRRGSLRFSDCNSHYFLVDPVRHLVFRLQSLAPRWLQIGLRLRFSTVKRIIIRVSGRLGS